jgi:hypothetical protein
LQFSDEIFLHKKQREKERDIIRKQECRAGYRQIIVKKSENKEARCNWH